MYLYFPDLLFVGENYRLSVFESGGGGGDGEAEENI
jgi:hypothetical protein